jgi:hypothetical protein
MSDALRLTPSNIAACLKMHVSESPGSVCEKFMLSAHCEYPLTFATAKKIGSQDGRLLIGFLVLIQADPFRIDSFV